MRSKILAMTISAASSLGCAQIFGFEPGSLDGTGASAGAGPSSGPGSGTSTGGGSVGPPTGETVWSRSFGDAEEQNSHGLAALDDGVVVFGDFFGTLDFGDGPLQNPDDRNVYVATLAADDGATAWSNQYGDSGEQAAHDVVTTPDGGIVLGGSFDSAVSFGGAPLSSVDEDDLYLATLDGAGGHLWSKQYGEGNGQAVYGMAISSIGELAVTGGFGGDLDFGHGYLPHEGHDDVFVAVFDAQGVLQWSKGFGSPPEVVNMVEQNGDDEGTAVAFDSQGNVIVIGYFRGDLDIYGTYLEHDDDTDVFVVKFDPNGNVLWAHSAGGGDAEAYDLAIGTAPEVLDHIYIVGAFDGAIDFGGGPMSSQGWDGFMAVLDPNGGFVWQWSGGGDSDYDAAESVAVDAQGNAVVIGFFLQSMDWHGPQPLLSPDLENPDLFIVKIDSTFSHVWDRVWGDAAPQGLWLNEDVAIDAQSNIYVSAVFEGSIDTGVNLHTSQGALDLLVAKLKH